ncbi:MAG: methyltransferase domain-containing protein [Candidatus Omnitrophica bacterium]|nr:methyltransferase domain-containing protein [Candidatus Omnitrophota bacterium]MCB9746834.1 methyltransferase domain-containing protein [Candidatus Omnitrophota bacterium]
MSSVKLHLGCGTKRLDGWINIDSVETVEPDVVHDLSQPFPFQDLSVDEVLAEDLLEHFDKYLRFVVFYEWARVLKIGGKITIQVPNFKKILFKYFKFGYDNFVDFIFGENLWESEIYIGHFGNHKWGYSEETLKEFVELFGIETDELSRAGLNLRLVGVKKTHKTWQDLDGIQIPSHANKFGKGEAVVSLGQARLKILQFQESNPSIVYSNKI